MSVNYKYSYHSFTKEIPALAGARLEWPTAWPSPRAACLGFTRKFKEDTWTRLISKVYGVDPLTCPNVDLSSRHKISISFNQVTKDKCHMPLFTLVSIPLFQPALSSSNSWSSGLKPFDTIRLSSSSFFTLSAFNYWSGDSHHLAYVFLSLLVMLRALMTNTLLSFFLFSDKYNTQIPAAMGLAVCNK